MRTSSKIFTAEIVGVDVDDFSRSDIDYFIDPDFDRIGSDVLRGLSQQTNPRRKPWSDGGDF